MRTKLFIFFVIGCILIGTVGCRAAPVTEVVPPTPTVFIPEPPVGTPTPTAIPTPQSLPGELVQLIYFYRLYKETDLQLLANRFDLYILTEDDLKRRAQMVELGAKSPILQYLRFDAIHDPGDCQDQPWRNQVADQPGDFCRISAEHPDWFLLDQKGERIVVGDKEESFYIMDPGNQGWRDYFLAQVREMQEMNGWNGVFLDNVELSLSFREQEGALPANYPDDSSYQLAILGFLQFMYDGYFQPSGRPVYANLVSRRGEEMWPLYLPYLDGVMHEGWAIDWPDRFRSAERWEQQLALAEQTQSMGKELIIVSQGTQADAELQEFAFASFLLISQGRAYFRYANSDVYREVWLYDNYDLDLGLPLGPRYQEDGTWRRDFTKGWVSVNPDTHEVNIVVNP